MEGTLADNPLWWQILKVILFFAFFGVIVRFFSGKMSELNAKDAPSGPPESWMNGRPVDADALQPGDELLRDDGVPFVFLRKAEPNEFKQNVEEWLFHPPGNPDDFWIGMEREQLQELRYPAPEKSQQRKKR